MIIQQTLENNLKKCLIKIKIIIMNVTGRLVKILDKETGMSKSNKSWIKQNFVIETDAKYNPLICFDLFGEDKVDMLTFAIGDTINVEFNLSSREYKGKYYTQASAWKIENVSETVEAFQDNEDSPF